MNYIFWRCLSFLSAAELCQIELTCKHLDIFFSADATDTTRIISWPIPYLSLPPYPLDHTPRSLLISPSLRASARHVSDRDHLPGNLIQRLQCNGRFLPADATLGYLSIFLGSYQILEQVSHAVPYLWAFAKTSPLGRNAHLLRSARAVITKYHRIGTLNNRHLYLTALEPRSPRSGCQHGQVLIRALFMACRWLPSHCVLMRWRKISFSSSYKDTNPTRRSPPS